ncbi:SDR family NAD(P)-dependent oxidoreductase [Halomarina oriensis]|uniref:SDR family NAD(P)-dependent oxidoreductase n=1 Tax=Halomarina oriensis TaxID=671145 RepID=A0A6B0GI77_9EURY|nr:SDR family NAD(P)-dependent oxidoreductase [Halomarina oriensis]MWG33587.1 SDR family NAD(P)-dependent oxidoreductase [Halomarina oriensis]
MSPSELGRVVVVTGANEGIGYHLLRSLVDDGYLVAGFDVDVSALQSLRERHPEQVRYYECDVTDTDAVESAVDAVVGEWGRIDVLVNNAAVFELGRFDEVSPDATEREFDVNVFGYLRTIRAVLPRMRAQGGGIVHNVSSGVGQVGHPSLSGYAATKGAIEAFTRSLRLELEPDGIACTLLYPPATNTRSAARLKYPSFAVKDPEYVGRRLADRIESTDAAVYADWQTRLGMALVRRVPSLVKRGTERYV